ncbi:hypothetical protein D9613_005430 [Agrocybe pediades]|uniref:Uncharacterized protein n=1 Tax=Agrocybe pediades TaxID=84607 RepID=A0A8H4VRD8_9AGAR|nr:hypothetical protein D9613_005430 [Agrocybe pediades]
MLYAISTILFRVFLYFRDLSILSAGAMILLFFSFGSSSEDTEEQKTINVPIGPVHDHSTIRSLLTELGSITTIVSGRHHASSSEQCFSPAQEMRSDVNTLDDKVDDIGNPIGFLLISSSDISLHYDESVPKISNFNRIKLKSIEAYKSFIQSGKRRTRLKKIPPKLGRAAADSRQRIL